MGRKRRVHFHAHLAECRCGVDVRIICQNSSVRLDATGDPNEVTCQKCRDYLVSGEWRQRLFGTR